MKKVLVLVAAMLLVAANAMASGVVSSKHNMQSFTKDASNTNTEVCVFCHTPHAAITTNPNAPLWNRTNTTAINAFYNSATLSTASKSTTATISASIAGSDAPLCLSCHNGTAAVKTTLQNPPNGVVVGWTAAYTMNANAQIGTGLTNDHPIGMLYNSVVTIKGAANFHAASAGKVNGRTLYQNKMWCSTCHDVHDDASYPFLATSNAGSALCLDCHNK